MTSQIGLTSRKRTYSADSSIARPVARTASAASRNGHLEPGPARRHAGGEREDEHDEQVEREVERAVSTTDTGIAMRGNWILRTRFSRSTTEVTAPVPSAKNV